MFKLICSRVQHRRFVTVGIFSVFTPWPHRPQPERPGGRCGREAGARPAGQAGSLLILQPCIQHISNLLRSPWTMGSDTSPLCLFGLGDKRVSKQESALGAARPLLLDIRLWLVSGGEGRLPFCGLEAHGAAWPLRTDQAGTGLPLAALSTTEA